MNADRDGDGWGALADGTRRYLLKLDDGLTVETVLMPEGERDTICISSQVGCPVDCKFCMTALLGLSLLMSPAHVMAQAQKPVVVGVSWSNFQEERWKTDEAAIKARLTELGADYISADAQSSPSKQLADVESLRPDQVSGFDITTTSVVFHGRCERCGDTGQA